MRSRKQCHADDLPRVWHQFARHRWRCRMRAAQAGSCLSCLRGARRLQDGRRIKRFIQLARVLSWWVYCRTVSQREPTAESAVQRVRRVFRHSHATLQVVARDFLASHRSDNCCAGVRLAQCFIFEVSMRERVTTPPNKPDRANRRQPLGFLELVGEPSVSDLTAAVAHPGRSV